VVDATIVKGYTSNSWYYSRQDTDERYLWKIPMEEKSRLWSGKMSREMVRKR
jgi:hypothetical protein